MEPVVIEVSSFRKKIHEIINKYPLDNQIIFENINYEDRNIYIFKSENNNNINEKIIQGWTALLIQSIIFEVYMESLINKRLIKLLKAVGKKEKTEIKNGVIQLLKDYEHCSKEKSAIYDEIMASILVNNSFNIDGYLRFKPHKINSLIDKSIEMVIDDMEMESEYNEFIDMLQFYVDGQIPLIDMVNVIIEKMILNCLIQIIIN